MNSVRNRPISNYRFAISFRYGTAYNETRLETYDEFEITEVFRGRR
jgi:hypothetical protein